MPLSFQKGSSLVCSYEPWESSMYFYFKILTLLSFFLWSHAGQNNGVRKLLQVRTREGGSPFNRVFPDSPAPFPSAPSPAPATPPVVQKPAPVDRNNSASPSPLPEPRSAPLSKSSSSKNHLVVILAGVMGGVVFLLISIIGLYLCKTNKVATVKPWATGLSGQLQKAFVTGKSQQFKSS